MGLFSKPELRTLYLYYRFEQVEEFPAIQAYGDVLGQKVYCNAYYALRRSAPFWYEDEGYQRLLDALRAGQGRIQIPVTFKIKKGLPSDFTIDLEQLGSAIGNPDTTALELTGWGLVDKPEL